MLSSRKYMRKQGALKEELCSVGPVSRRFVPQRVIVANEACDWGCRKSPHLSGFDVLNDQFNIFTFQRCPISKDWNALLLDYFDCFAGRITALVTPYCFENFLLLHILYVQRTYVINFNSKHINYCRTLTTDVQFFGQTFCAFMLSS